MFGLESGWFGLFVFHGGALLGGCALDWLFGDPRWLPHPVRLMGRMIAWLEGLLRPRFSGRERTAGLLLAVLMCGFWTVVPGLLLAALGGFALHLPGRAGACFLLAAESLMCYQLLAAKDLCAESMKVCRSMEKGDVEQARRDVSMIVGRDTAPLDGSGILRAAVETVAENASDGVIAPMLCIALLGPVGGYLYKAVNTMDSMVGYKNDRYRELGRVAAKLDDLVNLIPSRLTGLLFCACAALLPGFDGRGAFKVFCRDRFNHASPNSAQSEAACAGALGLRLAGDAWYFGTLCSKPYIGDDRRAIEAADVRRINRLMFGAQLLFLVLWAGVLALWAAALAL